MHAKVNNPMMQWEAEAELRQSADWLRLLFRDTCWQLVLDGHSTCCPASDVTPPVRPRGTRESLD